jgi:hypothetical protein
VNVNVPDFPQAIPQVDKSEPWSRQHHPPTPTP